jgi:anti-sigma factor RsiW
VSCKELVELVTDYLEGNMPPEERQRFDEHLQICHGCVNYVEQMRATIAATGALREESVPPEAREALMHAFRDWKHG